jgi:putative membrane protein
MLKTTSLAALIALSLPLAGFAADTLSHSDSSFLKSAAEGGMYEVQAGRIALDKATNPQVKSFAQKMIDDHTKANEELSQLAASKGVKLPTSPSLTEQAKLKTLEHWSQSGFDEHFAKGVGVDEHEDDVKAFTKESTQAKDPDVKAFAAKTLPTLQEHLAMAKQLADATKNEKSSMNNK